MRLLITGANGQIGSRLTKRLIKDGHEVYPLSHSDCDVRDNDRLDEIFSSLNKLDIVIHLASHLPNTANPDFHNVNIQGTVNVINACRKYDVGKLIFASSMRVYRVPPYWLPVDENHPRVQQEDYGWTKYACEEMIRWGKLKYVIIRYGGVYGGGNFGVVHKFLTSDRITIQGDGKQSTDFIYIDDAVEGTMLLLDKEGIFNVSSGQETRIIDLANYCSHLTGAEITTNSEETDRPFRFVSDVTKVNSLGLRPRNIIEGIGMYWKESINDRR
jgi:UDP-glucose 4-epimerase